MDMNGGHHGVRIQAARAFGREDDQALLVAVRTVLPIKSTDWDEVLTVYHDTHAAPFVRAQRTAAYLRVKFQRLLRVSKPTGMPQWPEQVTIAKEIQLLIAEKASIAHMSTAQRDGGASDYYDILHREMENMRIREEQQAAQWQGPEQ